MRQRTGRVFAQLALLTYLLRTLPSLYTLGVANACEFVKIRNSQLQIPSRGTHMERVMWRIPEEVENSDFSGQHYSSTCVIRCSRDSLTWKSEFSISALSSPSLANVISVVKLY